MYCLICASGINKNDQYYMAGDLGIEITAMLENLGQEFETIAAICSPCFINIMNEFNSNENKHNEHWFPNHSNRNNIILCICCQRGLGRRRCHSVQEGPERYVILERISPRQIPDGAVVCHVCWTIAQQTLKRQGVSYLRSPNIMRCVWCLRSLSNTRRHTIPQGPERNIIMAKIHPREIPPGGCVCYACWVSARRSIPKTTDIKKEQRAPRTPGLPYGVDCVWCKISLYQRQVCMLHKGPERDLVAERIYPKEDMEESDEAEPTENVVKFEADDEDLNRPTSIIEITNNIPRQYTFEEHSSKRQSGIQDEYDAIGINVAAKLRSLPPSTRIIAEKLINDLLFQAQVNGLTSSTVISTPDPIKQDIL